MARDKFIRNTYPCMILCAGTSKRFGGDKMLAGLAGQALLQHVIDRARPQVANLAVNGDPGEYSEFGLPVFADSVVGKLGPLAGVLTAMEWGTSQGRSRVLTISGDTPFVPKDWARKLAATPDNIIALPKVGENTYQVCGLWPTALAPDLRKFLRTGESYKVRDFLALYEIEMVEFPKVGGIDPFFNINTRVDMERAETIMRGFL